MVKERAALGACSLQAAPSVEREAWQRVTAGAGPPVAFIIHSFKRLERGWSREKWLSNPKDNRGFHNLNVFLCQRPQKCK